MHLSSNDVKQVDCFQCRWKQGGAIVLRRSNYIILLPPFENNTFVWDMKGWIFQSSDVYINNQLLYQRLNSKFILTLLKCKVVLCYYFFVCVCTCPCQPTATYSVSTVLAQLYGIYDSCTAVHNFFIQITFAHFSCDSNNSSGQQLITPLAVSSWLWMFSVDTVDTNFVSHLRISPKFDSVHFDLIVSPTYHPNCPLLLLNTNKAVYELSNFICLSCCHAWHLLRLDDTSV